MANSNTSQLLGKKSVGDYATKAGATNTNQGGVLFPSFDSLTAFYKNIVTDIVQDFVALEEAADAEYDTSTPTDVEPKPSTASNPYHGPAIDEAVGILHNLGYTYKMTETGLGWVQDGLPGDRPLSLVQ